MILSTTEIWSRERGKRIKTWNTRCSIYKLTRNIQVEIKCWLQYQLLPSKESLCLYDVVTCQHDKRHWQRWHQRCRRKIFVELGVIIVHHSSMEHRSPDMCGQVLLSSALVSNNVASNIHIPHSNTSNIFKKLSRIWRVTTSFQCVSLSLD